MHVLSLHLELDKLKDEVTSKTTPLATLEPIVPLHSISIGSHETTVRTFTLNQLSIQQKQAHSPKYTM